MTPFYSRRDETLERKHTRDYIYIFFINFSYVYVNIK